MPLGSCFGRLLERLGGILRRMRMRRASKKARGLLNAFRSLLGYLRCCHQRSSSRRHEVWDYWRISMSRMGLVLGPIVSPPPPVNNMVHFFNVRLQLSTYPLQQSLAELWSVLLTRSGAPIYKMSMPVVACTLRVHLVNQCGNVGKQSRGLVHQSLPMLIHRLECKTTHVHLD